MELPLGADLKIGVQNINRRTEPAVGPWLPKPEEARQLIELVERSGFDSIWVGDHVAFSIPYLDPLMQLMQAAIWSRRLTIGTDVYLLPLRHPGPVAKQIATLDLFSEGRVVFGVGVGGEFPVEYELCGVPITERGARLSEGIAVVKKLWSGEPVSNDGPLYPFPEVRMLPAPAQTGGPPVWCGGRSKAALVRAGRLADGWVSYVTTPQIYRESLDVIAAAAAEQGRYLEAFDTAHLLFARVDDDYETSLDLAAESLSVRYAMDFRSAAKRYAALGPPESIAATLNGFFEAGVRHVIVDFVGPYETRPEQIMRFAEEVRPLLGDVCASR